MSAEANLTTAKRLLGKQIEEAEKRTWAIDNTRLSVLICQSLY